MSTTSSSSEQQTALFRRLKPFCTAVSDYALRVTPSATSKDLQAALTSLYSVLLSIDDQRLLTPAIADYVFYPLSHILRRKDEWPERVIELTLSCVRALLETGWSSRLGTQMFEQFCLMLVVITEGKGKSVSEEVKAVSVGCLIALFRSARRTIETEMEISLQEFIRSSRMRPLLGHTATVLLDVVKIEALLTLRLDALQALSLLYTSLDDGQVVAGFLPLTVSTLSRSLSSSPATTNHTLLVTSLNVLCETLTMVMNDKLTPSPGDPRIDEMYHTEMTDNWYRGSKSQVRIALESFFPFIRIHSHNLVREAIINLSATLFFNCSRNLDLCQSLFLETILSLQHDPFPSVKALASSSLQRLQAHDSLRSIIKATIEESLHTWCLALPRTMISNDDIAKVNVLQGLTSALESLSAENSTISSSVDTLISSIQDFVVFDDTPTVARSIQASKSLQMTFQEDSQETPSLSLRYSNDERVSASLEELLHAVGRTTFAAQIVDKLVLEASLDSDRSASRAWIALQILQGGTCLDDQLDELYSLATDWLIRSDLSYSAVHLSTPTIITSLNILAFTATSRKLAFRQDLIDVLYPLLSLLAHSSIQVQSATRQTLECIALSTGHNDTQDLILENTDYLVNSVALKLNVFDVSVQVLATLYTVTKLAGPRIIPYMDDIWVSLFDVVDRFHGYEKLVTGVFAVMTSIVDVVSQSIKFSPAASSDAEDIKHDSVCYEIRELIDTIRKNEDHLPPKSDILTIPKLSPLPPKTAILLQTLARKSVLLTTHPSPHLRFNLIHLLRKALPLLSIPSIVRDGEQDPFLPLLAQEVWPAICSKLTDKEAWVVNAALEVVADLLALEGSFFGSKVEKDVWPALKGILAPGKKGKLGKDAVPYESDAATKALTAIVQYSDQKPALFDEMLDIAWPSLKHKGKQSDTLRNAFKRKNGDAVWLLERVDPGEMPGIPEHEGFFKVVQYVEIS